MSRILLSVIVIYVAVALYSVFDAAVRDKDQIRIMPKAAWIAVIILVPLVGLLLWFLFGRGTTNSAPTRGVAPDDDPEYLRKISEDLDWERRKKQGRNDSEEPGEPGKPHSEE
ncbi:PLD nuclease N-terminal domain-containing protein [Brevibacterium sp. UMB10442]|nr:PLD nuclease N-terminal domain-containing protein [Brevibacterium sp. UMB10442]